MKKENILILAAHPDDGEFGCGASLHKLSKNYNIFYAAFSPCLKSVPKGAKDDLLFRELKNAAKHLNIKDQNIRYFNYPVREFYSHRQDILEDMIKLKKSIKPIQIFLPNSFDIHQDHQVIHNEGKRAFKYNNVLGYELPWNNIESKNDYKGKTSIKFNFAHDTMNNLIIDFITKDISNLSLNGKDFSKYKKDYCE